MTDAPRFCWWMTSARAKSLGCTHHARFMGIIPGFIGDWDGPDRPHWVSRSDALNWLEDVLSHIWTTMRWMRGEEPDFCFVVGRPIA